MVAYYCKVVDLQRDNGRSGYAGAPRPTEFLAKPPETGQSIATQASFLPHSDFPGETRRCRLSVRPLADAFGQHRNGALTAIHRGGAINAELLDPAISVAAAQFSDSSNGRDFWTERLDARDEGIALTWYKCSMR
jgi:hypothetical protein